MTGPSAPRPSIVRSCADLRRNIEKWRWAQGFHFLNGRSPTRVLACPGDTEADFEESLAILVDALALV